MQYLDLDALKDHLRIDRANTASDDELTLKGGAAETWLAGYLNRALHTLDADSPPASPFTLPNDVMIALMLHVEAYFSRDPAQMEQLLDAARNLVYPYRLCIGV